MARQRQVSGVGEPSDTQRIISANSCLGRFWGGGMEIVHRRSPQMYCENMRRLDNSDVHLPLVDPFQQFGSSKEFAKVCIVDYWGWGLALCPKFWNLNFELPIFGCLHPFFPMIITK